MTEQFELGSEAIEYIRGQLRYGKSLANFLLNSVDFDGGHVTVFLPEDTTAAQLLRFQYGGVVKSSESREKVMTLIRQHLLQMQNAYCVFEEPVATLDNQTA